MNDKKDWADEPTPLCDGERVEGMSHEACFGKGMYPEWKDSVDVNFARDLERRLRHANALIGKLRADTDCGDFGKDDLEQRLANIEETLMP